MVIIPQVKERHIFKISDNGETFWYSAENLFDAAALHSEMTDNVYIGGLVMLPDDELLTLVHTDESYDACTKTCGEWAKDRHFMAATVW
jgi:hypothetical protein